MFKKPLSIDLSQSGVTLTFKDREFQCSSLGMALWMVRNFKLEEKAVCTS